MAEDHVIFIGGKPFMNYVTAVVMQFTTHGAEKVTIRSRGKFISRAVDVAEVVKSRFLRNQVEVSNIEIGSEEFENKEGRKVRVSTIDVSLSATGSAIMSAERSKKKEKSPAKETPAKEVLTEEEEVLAEAATEEATPG